MTYYLLVVWVVEKNHSILKEKREELNIRQIFSTDNFPTVPWFWLGWFLFGIGHLLVNIFDVVVER